MFLDNGTDNRQYCCKENITHCPRVPLKEQTSTAHAVKKCDPLALYINLILTKLVIPGLTKIQYMHPTNSIKYNLHKRLLSIMHNSLQWELCPPPGYSADCLAEALWT